jgi:hypothetical protein
MSLSIRARFTGVKVKEPSGSPRALLIRQGDRNDSMIRVIILLKKY